MCLIINELPESPLVAKKDTLVFKIVLQTGRHDDVVKSGDKMFTYERGKHYYQDKEFEVKEVDTEGTSGNAYAIYEGLHAFTSEKKARSMLKLYKVNRKDVKAVVVKMLIPEGTKYYINRHDKEIVANELIYPPKQWRLTAQTL